jgi:hypothetical protein
VDPTAFEIMIRHLASQGPILVVAFLGMVASLYYWGTARLPALLTLLGLGLYILSGVGWAYMQGIYLAEREQGMSLDHQQVAQLLATTAHISGGARAVGLALVITAVFVRRKPRYYY